MDEARKGRGKSDEDEDHTADAAVSWLVSTAPIPCSADNCPNCSGGDVRFTRSQPTLRFGQAVSACECGTAAVKVTGASRNASTVPYSPQPTCANLDDTGRHSCFAPDTRFTCDPPGARCSRSACPCRSSRSPSQRAVAGRQVHRGGQVAPQPRSSKKHADGGLKVRPWVKVLDTAFDGLTVNVALGCPTAPDCTANFAQHAYNRKRSATGYPSMPRLEPDTLSDDI